MNVGIETIMLVNFIGHVVSTLSWLILSIRLDYSGVVHLRFCGVLCIARSVSANLDRHAQLTRCFSAIAELLVDHSNINSRLFCIIDDAITHKL